MSSEVLEQLSAVRIITADGHEFVADVCVLNQCDVLSRMIENKDFISGRDRVLKLESDYCKITGKIFQKVLEYLYYKWENTDTKQPIPEFPIEEELVLDLLPVANYLGLNY